MAELAVGDGANSVEAESVILSSIKSFLIIYLKSLIVFLNVLLLKLLWKTINCVYSSIGNSGNAWIHTETSNF